MGVEIKPDYNEIVSHFMFEGEFVKTVPYGFGHINDTYAAYFNTVDGLTNRYILQRVNHHIFKEPEKLIQNIKVVTEHLRQKIIAEGGDPDRGTLNLIPTSSDDFFYKSEKGNFWRGYTFIENAKTYQIPKNRDHVYSAAKAFGNFLRMMDDFPVDQLNETIPHFHNTKKRFQAFQEAVLNDIYNRAQFAHDEIDFVIQRENDSSVFIDNIEQGKLPLRVTHNDTKFNNVLIDDDTGEGVCVIDLDTVMPGLSLYDFGDAIRSLANTAEEDEQDLSKVNFSPVIYDSFSQGFLDSTREYLTPLEIDFLAFSARLMTLENGIRFLEDYLNGDNYFKIQRENHNLDRCRTQFKLVSDMERENDQMKKVIQSYM
jgi:hypothetical protein